MLQVETMCMTTFLCVVPCVFAMAADVRSTDYPSISDAISACAVRGGGRVVVPPGRHETGPVHFRSNVELHLQKGAQLVFSDDSRDYLPAVRTSWEGSDCLNYSPLVYAYGCTNVALTGSGTLAPRLRKWVPWRSPPGAAAAHRQLSAWRNANAPVEERDLTKMSDSGMRPHLVQFLSCSGVRLEGFSIRGAPFWTLHLCKCSDVRVKGLDVSSWGEDGIAMNNTDGIDIEMSRDVTVEDCTFRQNDDAIVIKAGRDEDGRRNGLPSENILIRNCTVKAGHVLLGIGSEVSAGVRNVRMENCRVEGEAVRLVFLKTNPRRGGFIENITVDGVSAKRVTGDIVCIETRYFYGQPGQEVVGPNPTLTRIEGLVVRNVSCEWTKRAVTLLGDPDYPVRGVSLENIVADVVFERFARIENIDGIKMDVSARKVYPDAQW